MYNLKRKRNYSVGDVLLLLLFGVLAALLIISYAPIFSSTNQIDPAAYARSIEAATAKTVERAAHQTQLTRPRSVEAAGYNVVVNVWEDVNGDGRRDRGEPGLSHIEVNVTMDGSSCAFHPEVGVGQCVGVPPFALLTDENGQAILASLAPPPAATGTTQIWVQLPDMSDKYSVTYNSDGSNEFAHILPWPAMPSGAYSSPADVYLPKRIAWGLQRKQ